MKMTKIIYIYDLLVLYPPAKIKKNGVYAKAQKLWIKMKYYTNIFYQIMIDVPILNIIKYIKNTSI